jgi:hypothetical protein
MTLSSSNMKRLTLGCGRYMHSKLSDFDVSFRLYTLPCSTQMGNTDCQTRL